MKIIPKFKLHSNFMKGLICLIILIIITIIIYLLYIRKRNVNEKFLYNNTSLCISPDEQNKLKNEIKILERRINGVNVDNNINIDDNYSYDSTNVMLPDYNPELSRSDIISKRTLSYAERPYLDSLYGSNPPMFSGNDINFTNGQIIRTPQELNALDRVYNPLRYPYKSPDFYKLGFYPNMNLPADVIGCGARNTPCIGGSQIPIANPLPVVPINNYNIAPINISTQGPLGLPQQVGILYKTNGSENQALPLFGRRKYPNDNKWEYYTVVGDFNVKVPLITKQQNVELGSNDIVFMRGNRSPYRVTIYENDFPQYIPYV